MSHALKFMSEGMLEKSQGASGLRRAADPQAGSQASSFDAVGRGKSLRMCPCASASVGPEYVCPCQVRVEEERNEKDTAARIARATLLLGLHPVEFDAQCTCASVCVGISCLDRQTDE